MDVLVRLMNLLGVAFLGYVVYRLVRGKGQSADATPTTEAADDEVEDHGAVCVACKSEVARFQAPTIVSTKPMFDVRAVDAVARWLGMRRETRWVLVIERPMEEAEDVLCKNCHVIARAECEFALTGVETTRAKQAADEAQRIAEFLSHGLFSAIESRTAAVRKQGSKPSPLRGNTMHRQDKQPAGGNST
jgi:hypothetical protein